MLIVHAKYSPFLQLYVAGLQIESFLHIQIFSHTLAPIFIVIPLLI